MNTFFDIVVQGDSAAAAGRPLVKNWVQMRGQLRLFGQSCGGLQALDAAGFDRRFPERFCQLPAQMRDTFPGAAAYESARRAILRLLALLGYVDAPWEALRLLIREAGGRGELEYHWGALKVPACAAGLAPAELRAEWVWGLAAETEGGHRRQCLRKAVVVFNKLFEIETIAASGLLPPSRIGPPPVYDRCGRVRVDLPPHLARYETGTTGLSQIWRAICGDGRFELPPDPGPDDLLAPGTWARIEALPQAVTGLSAASWRQYLARTRTALRPASTKDGLPTQFAAMVRTASDRQALGALWRQIRERAPHLAEASVEELLQLGPWRGLWHSPVPALKESSRRTYEARARKLLLQYSAGQEDPRCQVIRAWSAVPTTLKTDLAPIRKIAEGALLRPEDITTEWLEEIGFREPEWVHLVTALAAPPAVVKAEAEAPPPDPVAEAWQELRIAARALGVNTSRLRSLSELAQRDGKCPVDIDRSWAVFHSQALPHRQNATFRMALRLLDAMRDHPDLARHLPAWPIGSLPDRRHRGTGELPEPMARDLERLFDHLGYACSTRREGRAVVRKLYAAAVRFDVKPTSLEGLLTASEGLAEDAKTRSTARRLLKPLFVAEPVRVSVRAGARGQEARPVRSEKSADVQLSNNNISGPQRSGSISRLTQPERQR